MKRQDERLQHGRPLGEGRRIIRTDLVASSGTKKRHKQIRQHDGYLAASKLPKCKNYKKCQNRNLQKLIILEGLEHWEYENRIRHVEKARMQILSSVGARSAKLWPFYIRS